jgi:diadenosine tetraphosphatase ApaH/serine/threonine PP2A family protein phosphatase
VLVIHGGLFGRPGVTLADLEAIDRLDYSPAPPPDDAPTTAAEARAQDLRQLMRDALWSDPKDSPGSEFNSVRRQGQLFGPDVAAEFLEANGLLMLVRSHEWYGAATSCPPRVCFCRGPKVQNALLGASLSLSLSPL